MLQGSWSACCSSVAILWTVGGRLRDVYNGSTQAEERRRDRRATALRAVTFVIASAVLVAVDNYGSVAKMLSAASYGARKLLLF
ncbi:hypothetical protein ERJ75_000275300 [Trypanosoma vivax]|nr:hypothetical protein ERJ75_000275300 [Trypanosoma vivax]